MCRYYYIFQYVLGILNVLFAHKLRIIVSFHFMKIYSCYKDFALNLAAWI